MLFDRHAYQLLTSTDRFEDHGSSVEKVLSADVDDCVSFLADAFVASPLHLSAFGNGRIDQNRRFLSTRSA